MEKPKKRDATISRREVCLALPLSPFVMRFLEPQGEDIGLEQARGPTSRSRHTNPSYATQHHTGHPTGRDNHFDSDTTPDTSHYSDSDWSSD